SFDYTGTTLPEGAAAFVGRAFTATASSTYSTPEFVVNVDLTAPTLLLDVPTSTPAVRPLALVAVDDLYGIPDRTTATIDVDTNNNGSVGDPGETGYASGTTTNGRAEILLPTLAIATVKVRARANDRAGNEGTSSVSTMSIVSSTLAVTDATRIVDFYN